METALSKARLLQNGATTGNGQTADLKGGCREIAIYIVGSAGVGAGAVQLESSHDPAYTGTWAAHGSPVTVVASAALRVGVSGVIGAVRARISTTVTGGTVSVYLFAN